MLVCTDRKEAWKLKFQAEGEVEQRSQSEDMFPSHQGGQRRKGEELPEDRKQKSSMELARK